MKEQLYQMFQQCQTSSTPPSSTVTLARTGNPTAFITLSTSLIWIINWGASDHITGNKGIVSSLGSTYFFSITLVDGSTSVRNIGLANATSSTILIENILHYLLVMLVLILQCLWWDLSIALRKGKHTCTSYLISRFVSYSQEERMPLKKKCWL